MSEITQLQITLEWSDLLCGMRAQHHSDSRTGTSAVAPPRRNPGIVGASIDRSCADKLSLFDARSNRKKTVFHKCAPFRALSLALISRNEVAQILLSWLTFQCRKAIQPADYSLQSR
jgi:hypothetical protein